MPDIVDLRSDLLSRLPPAGLDALVAAAARPAEFDLRGEPTQRLLEARMAALLGKEDALLFPTCTMANLAALILLGTPGGAAAMPADIHVATSEGGGLAAFAGLLARVVDGVEPPLDAWEAAMVPGDALKPPTALIVLENTHNRAGGVPLAPAYTAAVTALARRHGIRSHLDGARLFNAAVALDAEPAALAAGFDTVSVSLNKGLAAPLGAVLAGTAETIGRALAVRQRLGGGIRPSALLCAPALAALDGWRAIAEDHRRAKLLAAAIRPGAGASVDEPRTNIVLVRLGAAPSPEALCRRLAEDGVLALPFGARAIRMTVYRGLRDEDVLGAAAAVSAALQSLD